MSMVYRLKIAKLFPWGTSYSLLQTLLTYYVSFSHSVQRHRQTNGQTDRQTDNVVIFVRKIPSPVMRVLRKISVYTACELTIIFHFVVRSSM